MQPERLTENDAATLEGLEIRLFPDNCMNEKTLQSEIKSGICWAIREDGEIVAYILARLDGELLDILRIGVLPDHRKKGLGGWLLDYSLRGVASAMLTVKKSNRVALSMYLRRGFRIVGELDAEAWVMQRSNTFP